MEWSVRSVRRGCCWQWGRSAPGEGQPCGPHSPTTGLQVENGAPTSEVPGPPGPTGNPKHTWDRPAWRLLRQAATVSVMHWVLKGGRNVYDGEMQMITSDWRDTIPRGCPSPNSKVLSRHEHRCNRYFSHAHSQHCFCFACWPLSHSATLCIGCKGYTEMKVSM